MKMEDMKEIASVVTGSNSEISKTIKRDSSDLDKFTNIIDEVSKLKSFPAASLEDQTNNFNAIVDLIADTYYSKEDMIDENGDPTPKKINLRNELAKHYFPQQLENINKVIKVISGFPGIGKSWLYNHQDKFGIKVSDSDSSAFSWITEGVRHPQFPANYIEHIKECIENFDVVLVSSHDVVRDALKAAGIEFLTVYPNINDKEAYIKRFIERGSKEAFVKLINDNWDQWIKNINLNNDDLSIELNLGEYLSDYVLDKHNKDSRLTFSIKGKF